MGGKARISWMRKWRRARESGRYIFQTVTFRDGYKKVWILKNDGRQVVITTDQNNIERAKIVRVPCQSM